MPSLRIFGVLLVTLGLIGFIGDSSFVTAGGDPADPPHETHLTHVRGPAIGSDCAQCHTGTPDQNNVDDNRCDPCHSPGGLYDGVDDSDIGVKNNWENRNSSDSANESMIYNGDGTLKADKDKWCATCHDRGTGTLVDDFEEYTDDAGLRVNWSGGADAEAPYLEPSGGPVGSKCMRVHVDWDKHGTTYGAAQLANDYVPPLDLEGMESISFYVKVEGIIPDAIDEIKVRLTKPDDVVCVATINTDNLAKNSWELVSIPLSDFTNNNVPGATLADQGVKLIVFRLLENPGTSNWYDNVYFDDINFSALPVQAPDVVGDNVTQGHYVTGHRFGCTSCHDPSSDHIDGETRSLYGYFTSYSNPTGFRFYSDSLSGLQLPYTSYVAGSEGSFALCYNCHDEAVITQGGDAGGLVTNFTDYGYIAGTSLDNLHLLHVGGPGSSMIASVYHGTCVMCHDPHGQANPAMTRTDMGDFIYFDANGCEIAVGADSDGDGTEDRHDPDVNMGGAQEKAPSESYPMCNSVCHTVAAPPNEPPCDPGDNPYTNYSQGMNGFYVRDYAYVSHAGTIDVGPICLTAGCHPVGQLHAAHFAPAPAPGFPLDETGCYNCHADGRLQCADEVLFDNSDPKSLAETTICADVLCHPNP
jgi:predicted CXXCH cytochrome family protein